jgi:predicted phosphate transport protein (TIGR00153 family)
MRSLTRTFSARDNELFDLFDQAGTNIVRAAELLDDLLRSWPDHPELARDITICEQEGDRITHDVYRRLHSTFVTPLDREDIHALASSLDDIVDYLEEVADYLGLYRIEAPMHQAQQLARVILHACREIAVALPELRNGGNYSRHTVEINRLENEGDRITRGAIASLFDDGIDPMAVVRWKDIYERLEAAIDSTERVANVLEGIALKNS